MAGESDIFSGIISAGLGAASGNPLAIAGGIAGIGLGIAGMSEQNQGNSIQLQAAKQKADAEKQIANLEIQQDAVRQKAMEISARRQSMETLRNQQRARAMALTNASSQGAQFGSGLAGGYGQISGQSGVNLLGVSQALGAGQQMFGLNNQINQQKMGIADASTLAAQGASQIATGQGLSKLGSSLSGSFGPIKNLSSNFLGAGNPAAGGGDSSYGSWMSGMGTGGLV